MKHAPLILALILAGCSTISPARMLPGAERYYLTSPTILEVCGGPDITDDCIVKFSVERLAVLRERMNNARLAREGGGVIQSVMGLFASMWLGAGGSEATSMVVSGASAIVPNMAGIFHAEDRATVFAFSVKAIEDGQATYLLARARPQEERRLALTQEGATLYQVTVSALHVAESLLVDTVPSLGDLQKIRSDSPS